MKTLKKLAPVFRGLAAVVAGLLALISAAVPLTKNPEVRTAIDGAFGIETRVRVKKTSSVDEYEGEYVLCAAGYSDVKPFALEPKPSNPDIAAPEYETFTPAWEYVRDGVVIGLGVLTGVLGAAWLVTEFVPVAVETFGKGKEEE